MALLAVGRCRSTRKYALLKLLIVSFIALFLVAINDYFLDRSVYISKYYSYQFEINTTSESLTEQLNPCPPVSSKLSKFIKKK